MDVILSLGEPLKFIFEKVLLLIKNPEVPFAIATLMVISGLWIYFLYKRKSNKLNKELYQTTLFVKNQIIPNEEDNINNIGPQDLFLKKFQQIKNKFEKTIFLKEAFSEYTETLIYPKEKDSEQFIKNSIRPHDHFNEELIEIAGINYKSAMAWPNYFIGFGLLITFIGLVGALDVASDGLQEVGSSAEDMQQTLRTLLSTASFKFITSVFGILISLFLGYFLNKLFTDINKKISELNRLIEKGVIYTFAEKILSKIAEISEDSLTTQRLFRESLGTALGDSLGPLNQTLKEFAEKVSSLNTDAMSEMIKEFEKTITGSSKDHIENVSKSLEMVSTTLSSFSKSTDKVSDQFKEDVNSATNSLKLVIEDFRDILKDSNKEFQQVSNSIKDLHEQTASAVQSITGISAEIKNTGEVLENSSTKMTEISSEIGKLLDKYKDTNNEIANMVNAMGGSFGAINDNLNNSFNKISETWNKYDSTFNNFGDQTEKAYKEFGLAISNQVSSIQNFAIQVDKNFGEAIDKLAPQIQSLDDAVNSIPVEDLANSLDQSIEKLDKINTVNLENISEKISQIEENQNKVADQLNDIKNLEESLNEK